MSRGCGAALAATLALGACQTDWRTGSPLSLDAGPDLRIRPRAMAMLRFRVTGVRDTAAPWPYEISWGDGSADHGRISDSHGSARVSHTYRSPGRYAVQVSVIASDSVALSDTLTAYVEPAGTPQVFVGAGDIASCGTPYAWATAQLVAATPGTVFALGDNAYPYGSHADYQSCYQPTWGRVRKRTHPVPGNHDYLTRRAAGYFDYFGVAAGDPAAGYYSYELGDWHIIALNSNQQMGPASPQERWLRADLATHAKLCTLAYWHHARFSSGTTHGSTVETQPLWQALYDAGADVVLSGHEHNYERFAPQTPDGRADPIRGIREFVVGTGGGGAYRLGPPIANSETRNTDYGVLQLTLEPRSYRWRFIPVVGATFRDSGSAPCH